MPITAHDNQNEQRDYVSTAEAREMLSVSDSRIRQISAQGRLGDVYVYDAGTMRPKTTAKRDQYRESWYLLETVEMFRQQRESPAKLGGENSQIQTLLY